MIKTIIFDLGGVVITLAQQQAVERFKALGLEDAEQRLDSYTQSGIFGDLEHGLISDEDFRRELSVLLGHEVTHEECAYAWRFPNVIWMHYSDCVRRAIVFCC